MEDGKVVAHLTNEARETSVWAGRPKQDDNGLPIDDAPQPLLDSWGNMEEMQEITGYERPEPDVIDAGDEDQGYVEGWSDIAAARKNDCAWTCEECRFRLFLSPAIQVHHVDKDKGNNIKANLQVLCLTCHKGKHGNGDGMGEGVPARDMKLLDAWHRRLPK